jgi:molecular chaperone HtpG
MLSEEKFFDKAQKFALYPNVDDKYFTFDELKEKISKTQTDKDGKLVILYASNKNEQHPYIEAAKEKGYEVLLLDSPIISHLIQKLETKNEKATFSRVDADVIDKLIKKENEEISKLTDKEKEKLKKIIEEAVPKEKYTVQLEAMDSNASPFIITFPEFMRRMKEMQQSGGNSMFGNMPEMYNLIINVNNPVNSEILKSKSKDKKQRLINQSLDLAKLSQNLLKGEELTSFIKRSVDFIK